MLRNRLSRPRCRRVDALSGELCASNVALGKGFGSAEQSARVSSPLGHALLHMGGCFSEQFLQALWDCAYSERRLLRGFVGLGQGGGGLGQGGVGLGQGGVGEGSHPLLGSLLQ